MVVSMGPLTDEELVARYRAQAPQRYASMMSLEQFVEPAFPLRIAGLRAVPRNEFLVRQRSHRNDHYKWVGRSQHLGQSLRLQGTGILQIPTRSFYWVSTLSNHSLTGG